MKASDLRIGNVIKWNNDSFGIVITSYYDSNGDDVIIAKPVNINYEKGDVSPMPLTEQWLFDFHIKRTDTENIYLLHWKGFYFKLEKVGSAFFLKSSCGTTESKGIKYVHELQNLYHAVSGGEELTLKK